MKRLVIEFDESEIDELMAVEAVKGFELPFVKEIYVLPALTEYTCEVMFDVPRSEGLIFRIDEEQLGTIRSLQEDGTFANEPQVFIDVEDLE
ncbi:hypothetical protein KY326_03590 [Candidatus Woesearchaeota archaeon]|nr:hypothetical protein [Candidatus Woesearchaeota archaeon]